MDSNVYGPALPPGFKKKDAEDHNCSPERPRIECRAVASKSDDIIGPQLPSHLVKQKEEAECREDDSEDSTDIIGPALPPGLIREDSSGVIGPALPPGFALDLAGSEADSDSDSDSVYGPMPADNSSQLADSVENVVANIEKRATDMKKKLQGSDKPVENVSKREEWMTLPATDYKNQFGVISRCLVDSDPKSSKKRPSSVLSEEVHHSVKNERLKEELDKYNKSKRPESLLELHQKNKKRKEEKESKKPKERKAFDREAELGVRLMDQRQVNSVLRNARKLNSRFSAGASQYL